MLRADAEARTRGETNRNVQAILSTLRILLNVFLSHFAAEVTEPFLIRIERVVSCPVHDCPSLPSLLTLRGEEWEMAFDNLGFFLLAPLFLSDVYELNLVNERQL